MINNCNQLIGLSLSYCVSDILKEDVKLDNVTKMYVGCVWQSNQEFLELLEQYHQSYWRKFNFREIEEIVDSLLPIIQITRLFDPPRLPNTFRGHWVTDESDISWHIYNKQRDRWTIAKK